MGLLLFGCSANNKPLEKLSSHNPPSTDKIIDNTYWWRCNFKNVWLVDERPDFVIDLLLAHAVVSPILVEHINEIPYWRFHRRAARDQTGHQFSLLFYSKPEVASAVFEEISKSEVLIRAHASHLVEKVILDDPNNPVFSSLDATSDHHWSPNLQENWPSFIMGVSTLWLGLIEDSFQGTPEDFADINKLLERYREIDELIAEIWKREGQHALLHHLNAVFGYKPLIIDKELAF